jgi:NAD(P)-dependent dehydrogenase (short-subunit alcohol dehydrogenase family)
MKIENAVVLVTGANRGIGLAFARELLARGARKAYAGAREPAAVSESGVHALRLDVTRPDDAAAAAALASDVTLVINNAGIAQPGGFLAADSEEVARHIFETNFFAQLPAASATGGSSMMRRVTWKARTPAGIHALEFLAR